MSSLSNWFTYHVCEGDPFPLFNNFLSTCFVDVILFGLLALFIVVLGTFRIFSLRHSSPEQVPEMPVTRLHVTKNVIPSVFVILLSFDVVYHILEQSNGIIWPPVYKLVKNGITVGVWFFSVCVMNYEYFRGRRQNWILRTWWTLCFLVWSIKLNTSLELKIRGIDLALLIGEFSLVTMMCLIGLFLNRVPVLEGYDSGSVASAYGTFITPKLRPKYEMCDDDEMEGEEVACGGPSREQSANVLSRLVFWWLNPLLKRGFRRPLEHSDLMDLNLRDESGELSAKLKVIWIKEKHTKKPSLVKAIRKLVWGSFAKAGFYKVGNDIFIFIGPLVLHSVIGYLENPSEPAWIGIAWVGGLFVGSLIQSLCANQYFYYGYRVGMNIRTALITAVYEKSLVLSSAARMKSTSGEIVNLQSIDAQKLADLIPFLHLIWSAPLQIILATAWLVLILGPSALAGVGIMFLLVPFNILLARTQGKYQKKIMAIKDSRAKLMHEILNGIRVIKFFVWEKSMLEKVNSIRDTELKALKNTAYLRAGTIFLWTSTPLLVAIATFSAYSLSGHELRPDAVFTSLALFNILRFPLNMLPNVISSIVEARVSLKRIQTFLLNEELDPQDVVYEQDPANPSVVVSNGSYSWANTPTLHDINIEIMQGQLVAIIAPVGAGKTSLMSALLGEIKKQAGEAKVCGSLAYVSQQAWIQNATVKDNILFGSEFNQEKYDATLRACELLPDIQVLPNGDLTEIGEKGINLSGGQKQRVNCARAVYQMADVYFFDDPLSAVDAHVGRNIFNECIKGLLCDKTRILVTHQLHLLPDVDKIIMLNGNGQGATVAAQGTYEELMHDPEFSRMMRELVQQQQQEQPAEQPLLQSLHPNTQPVRPDDVPAQPHASYQPQPPLTAEHPTRVQPISALTQQLARHQAQQLTIAQQRAQLMQQQQALAQRQHLQTRQQQQSQTQTQASTANNLTSQFNTQGMRISGGIQQNLPQQPPQQEQQPSQQHSTQQVSQIQVENETKEQSPLQSEKKVPISKLMTVEERRVGHIGFGVYRQYLSYVPGGYFIGTIILFAYVTSQAASIGSNLWLAAWSNKGVTSNVWYYLGIYAALGLTSSAFVIMRSFLVAFGGLGAAKKFHEQMMDSAMRAPVAFYDTTPIGRVLNRFTKDIADVDQMVPTTLMQFTEFMFTVLGVLIVISFATPWFLVPLVPLAFFYRYIQKYYVRSSRELKRLDSISKSPIFSHFAETLSGLSVIRAYRRVSQFVAENERRVDHNAKAYFALFASNRWLGIRLEFIGYSVVTLAALFAVLQRGSINPGIAGLAMSYSLSLTALLNFVVRQSAEVENQLVSVERVIEYTSLPQEGARKTDIIVPESWPSEGRIVFQNVSLRYRPGLPLVLKNVSFSVKPREKVGIVGRTGSGKSSIVQALFRMVEVAADGGSAGNIIIDDMYIGRLGLDVERSRLGIIPQDPVLFTGSVRSNVDPTETYTDKEIWDTLDSVHMKQAVEALPEKLDSPVAEFGENFSVGQRQLLCMVRALLKKSKIIVMDEATAAVDMQTDALIQHTIRTEFANMTVITIAHRIYTIMDYDRVAVMDDGVVLEFDSPSKLLQNRNSNFYRLVQESQH